MEGAQDAGDAFSSHWVPPRGGSSAGTKQWPRFTADTSGLGLLWKRVFALKTLNHRNSPGFEVFSVVKDWAPPKRTETQRQTEGRAG